MDATRREALRALAALLRMELDDRETSDGELVDPGPVRGTELYAAVQAVEATYDPSKLPVKPWRDWRAMLQYSHARHKRTDADPVAEYYVAADRLAEWVASELKPLADAGKPDKQPRKQRGKWVGEALLLLKAHPEWTDARIAKELTISPSTLARNDEYKRISAMARSPRKQPRRGMVSGGDLDAYEEE